MAGLSYALASAAAFAGATAQVPASSPSGPPSSLASEIPAHAPDSVYRVGDEAFLARQNDDRARQALVFYREQHKREAVAGRPSFEIGWRLAMADYFVGLRLTPDHDEQVRLFAEGRDAGRPAAEAAPNCAACHFWTAINMALYGDRVGALKMLVSLGEIRKHLERTIAIDPTYASGGAYRLLGLISQKLPGILGGSNAEARRDFELAIAAAPDEPLNYLFLAKLLDEELHDRAAAFEAVAKGLAVPTPAPNRLESIEALRDLRGLRDAWTPSPVADAGPS